MDRQSIKERIVKAMIAYQDQITIFSNNTAINAIIEAISIVLSEIYYLYIQVKKKIFLNTATGSDLDIIAGQSGLARDKNIHATTTVVFIPESTTIVSVAGLNITVTNGENFEAGDTVTIRKATGDPPDSEQRTISAKPSANVLTFSALTNTYVANDLIILQVTIGEGTRLIATEGPVFETTSSVTTGQANALFFGENTHYSLADKCTVKCTEPGSAGNVGTHAINRFETEISGISKIFNPLPGYYGNSEEDDFILRNKLFMIPTTFNQETESFFIGLSQQANSDVLRGYISPTTDAINDITLYLFHRQGSTFSSTERTHIKEFIEERIKSGITVTVENGTFTAVQIEAKISILSGYNLNGIFEQAASAYASFIDFRTWEFGTDIDQADLESTLNDISGVGNVEDFTPIADVSVADNSIPRFVSLKLTDLDNLSNIMSSDINQEY